MQYRRAIKHAPGIESPFAFRPKRRGIWRGERIAKASGSAAGGTCGIAGMLGGATLGRVAGIKQDDGTLRGKAKRRATGIGQAGWPAKPCGSKLRHDRRRGAARGLGRGGGKGGGDGVRRLGLHQCGQGCSLAKANAAPRAWGEADQAGGAIRGAFIDR